MYKELIINKIINYKNYVENSYRLIDINLKKRADLVPNLVKIVNTYKNFENDLFEEIVQIRNNVKSQDKIDKTRQNNEDKLSNDIKTLIARSEDYPDLKSNQNFIKLQKEIKRIEENLA